MGTKSLELVGALRGGHDPSLTRHRADRHRQVTVHDVGSNHAVLGSTAARILAGVDAPVVVVPRAE
jgi:hypothetical protein